jgi:hypothetical protein
MALDADRFLIRHVDDNLHNDVLLVCLDCGQTVDDEVGSSLVPDSDNTLARLLFLADDHATFYCKGPS